MIVRFRRNAMGHLAFKTQLVLAFGVAIVILVCIGVFSYSRALQEDADQNWVAHTHQVLEELDALLASLATQRMVSPGLHTEGDSRLVRVVLENLIGHSWKFTSKRERAQIGFGALQTNGNKTFFVRD